MLLKDVGFWFSKGEFCKHIALLWLLICSLIRFAYFHICAVVYLCVCVCVCVCVIVCLYAHFGMHSFQLPTSQKKVPFKNLNDFRTWQWHEKIGSIFWLSSPQYTINKTVNSSTVIIITINSTFRKQNHSYISGPYWVFWMVEYMTESVSVKRATHLESLL